LLIVPATKKRKEQQRDPIEIHSSKLIKYYQDYEEKNEED